MKRKVKLPSGGFLYENEAVRATELSTMLKNIIMQVVWKNRETRKVPKLKDILNDAIEQQKKR